MRPRDLLVWQQAVPFPLTSHTASFVGNYSALETETVQRVKDVQQSHQLIGDCRQLIPRLCRPPIDLMAQSYVDFSLCFSRFHFVSCQFLMTP